MLNKVRLALAAAAAVVCLSPSAEACPRFAVQGSGALIDPARIDQPLLDAAIAVEVNYERCRKGLSQLAGATPLRKTAKNHATWMALSGTLSHKSNRPGRSTVKARILASGLKIRRGSENIAKIALFRVEEANGYRIADPVRCAFTTVSGAPIPRHSYASIARYTVALWMKSPSHRVNILERKYTIAASAAAVDPRGRNCGSVYIAQNFAG